MNRIRTYADAEEALDKYLSSKRAQLSRDVKIERTLELAEVTGNPQDKLRVIHVAGTSGKTSTSYYISALLHAAGAKVGLTVSPHVDSIGERVQVNGTVLDEDIFCQYFEEYISLINTGDVTPTYFEFMMCFALWVFVKEGIDYAVVETGLGGLKDSSNICRRADKIGVITDIGLDHTDILGDTLEEIAANKAGIAWPGNEIIMLEQTPNVVQTVEQVVSERGGHLRVQTLDKTEQLFGLVADFQWRNWLLSYTVFKNIQQRDGLLALSKEQQEETLHTTVPGRMESWQVDNTEVILDGAHNEQKMSALLQGLELTKGERKYVILIGVKSGKDLESLVKLLVPVAGPVIASPFFQGQDLPLQSMDAEEVAAAFREKGVADVVAEGSSAAGFETALERAKSDGSSVLVTGSFFLVAEIREHIRKRVKQ